VKRFLKRPGGVDLYPRASVEWIRHHAPELHLVPEGGGEARVVALARFDFDGLHALFKRAGLDRPLGADPSAPTEASGSLAALSLSNDTRPLTPPGAAGGAVDQSRGLKARRESTDDDVAVALAAAELAVSPGASALGPWLVVGAVAALAGTVVCCVRQRRAGYRDE